MEREKSFDYLLIIPEAYASDNTNKKNRAEN